MAKTWSTPVCAGKSTIVSCSCFGASSFKPSLDCEGFNYVRCSSCGLVQINPQPVKAEINARYSSKFGKDYLSYEIKNENSFLQLQKLALKDAGFYRTEKKLMLCKTEAPSLLDIGCATGALLSFLRERGWDVKGVEISPAAEYARNVRQLDVRNIPLEEIAFPSGSFDIILASHLIEHLNDPFSFLKEAHRILKDSGYIFITTPNISGLQAYLYGSRWRSAIFDHLYLFSVHTLKKMLKKADFKTEKVSTWGGIAAGLAPAWIKKSADFLAKRLGFGDVMITRAKKQITLTKPRWLRFRR
jgi:2-polyprenyl-3-methyl-5-hydroxy-6-metoxy-1,4-benzoquinol methylase